MSRLETRTANTKHAHLQRTEESEAIVTRVKRHMNKYE